MSIDNPQTYGEWYWKHSVDAERLFDEDLENAIAPLLRNIVMTSPAFGSLPDGMKTLLDTITSPPTAGFGAVGGRFASEIADGGVSAMFSPALKATTRSAEKIFLNSFVGINEGAALFFRNKIEPEHWKEVHTGAGYADAEAYWVLEAAKPYPTTLDIFRWAKYQSEGQTPNDKVWEKANISIDDMAIWEWLSQQQLSVEQIHTAYRRQIIGEGDAYTEYRSLGWNEHKADVLMQTGWVIPNPMLLLQGYLQQGREPESVIEDIVKADIHPDFAQVYIDAVMTKPSSQDIIAYALKTQGNVNDVEDRLQKIGIHSDYFDVYKELAYPIPPIADLITMAVREAFSPAIAARFGQYEDYPPDFGNWAQRKGLTEEWSKAYWAAHWSLPSAQQGFEMLHRGVIGESDLNMLLRALDVMPFWRDKLIQIAYRPLTRVDVRRMYKEGVLNTAEVYKAYLDQGYSEKNAERMTEFTVKQTLSAQAKFTSTDIIKAFTQRMITRGEATGLLSDIGIRSENIGQIVNYAEYKREWDFTNDRISGIRNLYKKGVYK